MLKILANDGMSSSAIAKLESLGHQVDSNYYEGEELVSKLSTVDCVVIRSKTKIRQDLIDKVAGKSLKLIIRAGVGIDNIDHLYAEEKGIAVRNTPNSSSASVAELAIAHMFALARFVAAANVTMRQGEWNKKAYQGIELSGKKLGIVGFGRIGRLTAQKAQALGMEVYYYTSSGKAAEEFGCKYLDFNELLKIVDFISFHIPYVKEKGAVMGKEQFALMKDGAYLINCARGGVVDEAALLEALNSGKIAGAGIDVFAEEPTKNQALCNHPHVSVTPHIGASTAEAQERIGEETVDVIVNFFK